MKPQLPTVKLLEQMMAFRPVSDDVASVNRLTAFLRNYLSRQGVWTRAERVGARQVLFAAARRTRRPKLLGVTHLDVVPAEPELFTLKRRGDWLMGRGAGDCLGNTAVLTQALIRNAGRADVGAIFSTDEETGGATTAAMVQRGYGGGAVMVLDSQGLAPHIMVAQKGMLTLRLAARGRACHGSTPWLGTNAIDRLLEGYRKVPPLFPAARAGDAWHPTLSANMIQGGTAHNRVPDHAELVLDIRWTEAVRPADLVRRIRAASGLQVDVLAQCPVVTTDPHSPLVRDFARALQQALGQKPAIRRLNGATDARHFADQDVPILITGIPYEGPHASNERASARGLARFEDLLTAFLAHAT